MNLKVLIAVRVCTSIMLAQLPESWPAGGNTPTDIRNDYPVWHESDNRAHQPHGSPGQSYSTTDQPNRSSLHRSNNQLADSKEPEWVREYGSGMAPSDDAVADMKSDSQGNAIVTGSRSVYAGGTEWYTIKYDPDGNVLWGKALAGDIYGGHAPGALAVDEGNNIYITGGTVNTRGDGEFTTVKYDSDGNELWRVNYNPSTYSSDKAQVIALDDAGNIFVAGGISVSSYASIFSAVKYNNLGEQIWAATSTAQLNDSNQKMYAMAIATDLNGTIVITGGSENAEYHQSEATWATAKFDSSGQELWFAEHGDDPNLKTIVQSMAVDGSGYVYITGAGECNSILTICYTPDGAVSWSSDETIYTHTHCLSGHPAEGYSIGIDANGDIVVIGGGLVQDQYFFGIVLLKYTPEGSLQWMKQYADDESITWLKIIGMLLEQDGSIYATAHVQTDSGFSFMVMKFSPAGQHLWSDYQYVPSGNENQSISIDSDDLGNIFIATSNGSVYNAPYRNYAILKYSPEGDRLWDANYDGESISRDTPRSITSDNDGNVIVGATSLEKEGRSDWLILKYSPAGDLLWSRRYHMYEGLNYIVALVTDQYGNIYATGATGEPDEQWVDIDIVLIKYDGNGNLEWERQFDGWGGGRSEDYPKDIQMDHNGNVIILCRAFDSQREIGVLLLKYDPDGNLLWDTWYNYPDIYEYSAGMKVLPDGEVYVAGTASTSQVDFLWTVKYSNNGNQLWESRHEIPIDSWMTASGMGVTNQGDVYLQFKSMDNLAYRDILIKYDSKGRKKYEKVISDKPVYGQLIVDNSGNFIVPDIINNWSTQIVSKYSPGGIMAWSDTLAGVEHPDFPRLGIDGLNNVYLAGVTIQQTRQIYLAKYNSKGELQWINQHDDAIAYQIDAMRVDAKGNVYITSRSLGGEITILKYAAADDLPDVLPGRMSYAYPNPFNSRVGIVYDVAKQGKVGLKVFNLLGQEIANLVDWHQTLGTYRVYWSPTSQPSGIYFYQLQVGKKIESKKMVYLK
ncbi:T9SS type A sorting domain-containing protein [Candidatus Neomarinimicrobiota bacterium]